MSGHLKHCRQSREETGKGLDMYFSWWSVALCIPGSLMLCA